MSALTFKKVRSVAQSEDDDSAVKVELFQADDGRVCAWFIGPVRLSAAGIVIPYLPRSKEIAASVAIVRAVNEAKVAGSPVCVIDPDDLWDYVWQA